MTDAVKLLKAGKRYRGFLSSDSAYIPVTLTVYPLDARSIRIRYIFPPSISPRVRRGSTIYLLVEEGRNNIAELRVVKSESKEIIAVLDFVSEDRRRIPRVKVEKILEISAEVACGDRVLKGEVIDISLTSLSVRLGEKPAGEAVDCLLTIHFGGIKTAVRGRVLRTGEGVTVFEVREGNGDMVALLRKVYSEIFLKIQRGAQS